MSEDASGHCRCGRSWSEHDGNTTFGPTKHWPEEATRSAEPLVRPLTTDPVGVADLLPGGTTSASLVGHPGDVGLGLGTGEGGRLQSPQRKGSEVVAVQGVDRNGGPVSGSGAADDVLNGGPNGVHVHASSVDDNDRRCQELMTRCEHRYADGLRDAARILANEYARRGMAEAERIARACIREYPEASTRPPPPERQAASQCEHDWTVRGGQGDEWRECWLCGEVWE